MKLIRTVKLKLDVPISDLLPTFKNYTDSYNYVCTTGWNDNDFNQVSLHHKTYQTTKQFLPSQLAISSRMKASETLKICLRRKRKNKKVRKPSSKLCSIRLDKNSFNIWFNKNLISILTVDGRKKYEIVIPEYFQQYITWRRGSADLFIRRNQVFLNITFNKEIEDPQPVDIPYIIGVDRGIVNIAVSSNNKFYKGDKVQRVCNKYNYLRGKLQSCGSKSAKRHLKRLSKKENRFRRDVNHCISKEIVNSLQSNSIIVLEDLKYIRKRTKSWSKDLNRKLNTWPFSQLEQFLTYKAQSKQILVERVSAYYTSQKCSNCGFTHKDNRLNQPTFKCKKCNFQLNADLNASRVIELNYRDSKSYPKRLSVNQPIVSTLS
ncbi:MAG: RNA-guided endonuclease InsQ/TnpB family protein [Candidatus Heimdallarchaeaceae archaeon]